jgi:hypothetical protein
MITREKGRVGGELSTNKDAVYQRGYNLKHQEKKREQWRKGAKKFYWKDRKEFFPNYLCVVCNEKIEDNPNGRKFKCLDCKFKERAKEIKNAEELKALSREFTNVVLGHLRKDLICSECKKKKKIEFHHEVYPLTAKEIIEAYKKGLIVAVCRKCHRSIQKYINVEIQKENNLN